MSGAEGFRFGGRLALDLTWTLRFRAVAPTELLVEPDDLVEWVRVAVAPTSARADAALLTEAVRLREAIHAAAHAAVAGRTVPDPARRLVNRWAARPGPTRRLGPDGRARVVLPPEAPVAAALAAVAADAVDLLATRDGRLRVCAGPGCSLLFHDASPPGRRRWCAAERCGNRVNLRAHRDRTGTRRRP